MGFYVYELFDPRTEIVFYVGKGTRSRIDDHDNQPFYLLPILEEYKQRVIAIMIVRGQDWVNAICNRFGVEFTRASA